MTPAARYAAAIDVLDQILDGQPAEAALLKWARGNRYAGSKDRAAVRDHVFDCLRSKASFALKAVVRRAARSLRDVCWRKMLI
jgi:16S rRNA (cytosine967-C5)-methyltransferase